MDTIEVETTGGKLRGARKDGVNIFKGIPYGGRVSGERRFRRPAELEHATLGHRGADAHHPGGRRGVHRRAR